MPVVTVVVAFENATLCQKIKDLLETSGVANCIVCRSGDQVRRVLANQMVYCVVCGVRLADGPAEWLYDDLPAPCTLLMVGPRHQLDLCNHQNVIKLPTPMGKDEVSITVRLILQFGHRLERISRPRRSNNEQEEVLKAKKLLMKHLILCEEDAHRELQKRSMVNGARLVDTARRVIAEFQ